MVQTREIVKDSILVEYHHDLIDILNFVHLPGRFNNFFICYIYARLLQDTCNILNSGGVTKGKVGSAIIQDGQGYRKEDEALYISDSKRTSVKGMSYEMVLCLTKEVSAVDAAHTCGASFQIESNEPACLAIKNLLKQSMKQTNLIPTYVNNNNQLDRALDKLQIALLTKYMDESNIDEIYCYKSMMNKVKEYREEWKKLYNDIFWDEKGVAQVEQVLVDTYASFVKEPRVNEVNKKEIIQKLKNHPDKQRLQEAESFSFYEFVGVDEEKTVKIMQECVNKVYQEVFTCCNGMVDEGIKDFFEKIQQRNRAWD
jgi:hypothetical protein